MFAVCMGKQSKDDSAIIDLGRANYYRLAFPVISAFSTNKKPWVNCASFSPSPWRPLLHELGSERLKSAKGSGQADVTRHVRILVS